MNAMSLHIEPSSPDPIYRQIVGQIMRQVAAGQCPPGMRLPSVREVAAAHAINPMTVSKAYALLEANGVLERQRGKGMVVSGATAVRQTTQDRLATITPALHELSRQARELGLTAEQVLAALRPLLDEERKKSD
jgi:GntR family transcriptional regulator